MEAMPDQSRENVRLQGYGPIRGNSCEDVAIDEIHTRVDQSGVLVERFLAEGDHVAIPFDLYRAVTPAVIHLNQPQRRLRPRLYMDSS